MRTTKTRSLIMMTLTLAGCSGEGGYYDENGNYVEEIGTATQNLYADTNLLFMPTGDSHTTRVDLCWKNSNSGYATERGWVENVVNAGWEANSWIDFRWQREWVGECSSNSVPLENVNVWPAGDRNGVNFNFINPALYNGSRGCNGAQNCIEGVGVHEIGHVLGFDHEHAHRTLDCTNGPDFPKDDGTYTVDGDLRLNVDPDSVMGGCPTGSSALSQGDISALHSVYGGSGVNIIHGAYVAVRESNGKYWAYSGGNLVKNDSYSRWRLRRSGNASGSVKYGDKIYLQENGGRYLCGKKGTTSTLEWRTSYSSSRCDWEVKQSSSGNPGGTTLNVNDPFKLYLKIPATTPSEQTFEQTTSRLRMIKTTV